jgi:hypothetical protein
MALLAKCGGSVARVAKAKIARIARSAIRSSKLSGAFVYSIAVSDRKKMNSWSSLLLNEFPRMRKKNLTSARDRYAGAFAACLLASASSSAGRSAELHLPRSVES